MNRQYGFDPLPIQRRSLYSSRQQHAEQLHALDTSLYTHRASHVDPAASSSALSAPFSPSFPSPSPPPWSDSSHSAMAAMCYNPRQWSHSGPVSGSYMPFSHSPESRSQELTGMEGTPAFIPYDDPSDFDFERLELIGRAAIPSSHGLAGTAVY